MSKRVVSPGGTLDGVTLDLNPTTALFFNASDVAFGATSTIDLTGPMTLDAIGQVAAAGHATIGSDTMAATLTVNITKSNTPLFTNSGSMVVAAPIGADSEMRVSRAHEDLSFVSR